jgi:predicted RND superfamily exporter protein
MAPMSLFLATLLLALYYRRVYPTLLGLIPFFSGLGLFALGAVIFQFKFSFITIIALVMVFGCSIDYGVFAVDLAIGKKRSVTGVWTALSLSALVTVIGFIPLIFCKHPVLSALGQPLVLGTVGTYLGTVWGISGCVKFIKKFEV